MLQAIGRLSDQNKKRAIMSWLNRSGPFWDDLRQHSEEDLLECRSEVVTSTAVGEAAFRVFHGIPCGLVSVTPSNWENSPIEVTWLREDDGVQNQKAALENWWSDEQLADGLAKLAPPLDSWHTLRHAALSEFQRLTFSDECFAPLAGVPFARGSAQRCILLFNLLERLAREFDDAGAQTKEGRRLYEQYFTGDGAPFSDSSTTEKREFKKELTFTHPDYPKSKLFCPWHGKISHAKFRIHFSWPVKVNEPIYVVYVGPKITKR